MFFYRVGGNHEGSVHVEDLRVNSDQIESCRLFRQIKSQSEDRVSLHGKTSFNMYVSALREGNNYWFFYPRPLFSYPIETKTRECDDF